MGLAVASIVTLAHPAFAAGDDVFMDEGDGDFDAVPTAPAAEPQVKVDKAPAPRAADPVVEPAQDVPMLSDDSAAPAPAAPTEDPAAPVAAQPKEKKAKKKKAEKKAAKTAAAAPAASGSGGSFVVTKEACPMMRSPASTGETMLTVKASKKIWVEDAGEGWVKGFNKAGEPGYISKDCVQ